MATSLGRAASLISIMAEFLGKPEALERLVSADGIGWIQYREVSTQRLRGSPAIDMFGTLVPRYDIPYRVQRDQGKVANRIQHALSIRNRPHLST
nr:hypothetical protein [Microvirga sp. HBU65207]